MINATSSRSTGLHNFVIKLIKEEIHLYLIKKDTVVQMLVFDTKLDTYLFITLSIIYCNRKGFSIASFAMHFGPEIPARVSQQGFGHLLSGQCVLVSNNPMRNSFEFMLCLNHYILNYD